MKRLSLGDKGNAGTALGRATRAHEPLAREALTELALIEAMGGYRDYICVPMPKLHLYALALMGRNLAQEQQLKDARSSGGSSGPSGPSAPDEVTSVNRSDWRQVNQTTGDYLGSRE